MTDILVFTLGRLTMSYSSKGAANLQKSPQTHGSCSRITELKPPLSPMHALIKSGELKLATRLL